ncbi:hypothetical protein QBC32DRAFT_328052 [Pseudoneurospora amorphoporcata]|uniref:Uncharacterized protein n=1 Tax=Pseudoneurospora amorphoporcata TaxID=241081 RepID=A0AAN6SC29_9PEZI|nr:hypothetical protein QBC32DRAFT_328052 [Pseudoneurospora amorphoporcata]
MCLLLDRWRRCIKRTLWLGVWLDFELVWYMYKMARCLDICVFIRGRWKEFIAIIGLWFLATRAAVGTDDAPLHCHCFHLSVEHVREV